MTAPDDFVVVDMTHEVRRSATWSRLTAYVLRSAISGVHLYEANNSDADDDPVKHRVELSLDGGDRTYSALFAAYADAQDFVRSIVDPPRPRMVLVRRAWNPDQDKEVYVAVNMIRSIDPRVGDRVGGQRLYVNVQQGDYVETFYRDCKDDDERAAFFRACGVDGYLEETSR